MKGQGILFQTKSGHPEFRPPLRPPYMLSSLCITTKNRTILNMSDINQRRRKLFNNGRGAYPVVGGQHQYLGGGGLKNVHTRMHAHIDLRSKFLS